MLIKWNFKRLLSADTTRRMAESAKTEFGPIVA